METKVTKKIVVKKPTTVKEPFIDKLNGDFEWNPDKYDIRSYRHYRHRGHIIAGDATLDTNPDVDEDTYEVQVLGNDNTYKNLVSYYEKIGCFDTGIFATDILIRLLFENDKRFLEQF